jgi:AmmeMemoRadiSam system protein A
MTTVSSNNDRFGIPPDSGRLLVQLARHVVAQEQGVADAFNIEDVWNDPSLQAPGRAFVSLEQQGDLRGCIGFLEPQGPLYEVVERAAIGAAFKDPRFPPLKAEELDKVRFEVSVLTAPQEDLGERSTLPERIVIGRHGLIINFNGRRGVLLPQVPVEWGWGAEQFLEKTCMKAGVPASTWKDSDCRVFLFSSTVFREGTIPG